MNENDNPNVNDWQNDYQEWWNSYQKEMVAKADKLDAERRLKYNDAFQDFSREADAAGDWLEADWDQFKARVTKWWNEFEMETDETV